MKTITEAFSFYLAFPAGSAIPKLSDSIRSTALIESGSEAKGSPELFPSSPSWSLQMYVHHFERFQRAEHEAKSIGIVLCSDKDDVMVRITLPDEERIVAARYQLYLSTEEELRAELEREREEAERMLRLTADDRDCETEERGAS
ncbi:PDDEXK nuclease domain-containing protein [Sorangium sp. So ce327]|jgi:hypothetical protein|uniref:PDDEXK nuclease domain-containing protein n=1 Tax=Sorangium sp. So ce327 TaxID=3133301 RepID=UPI003F5E1A34